MRMGVFRFMIQYCKQTHKKHQLVSNTLTTIALLGAGDVITQYIEKKDISSKTFRFEYSTLENIYGIASRNDNGSSRQISLASPVCNSDDKIGEDNEKDFWSEYDWKRSLKMAAVGIFLGPFSHKWYCFLDKIYPKKNTLNIVRKVFWDQAFAAPVCNITSIFVCLDFENNGIREAFDFFMDKFMLIYIYDCAIWPVAQILNFLYVSPVYRVLYVNTVSLLWNTVLSYLMFEEGEENLKIDND